MLYTPRKLEDIRDAAEQMGTIGYDSDKLQAVIEAFDSFAGLSNAKPNTFAIITWPEQFQTLFEVVRDYVDAVQGAVKDMAAKMYELGRATEKEG